MKPSIRIGALIAALVVILLAAQAALADDTGTKESLAPDANACFEGGTLAGQCNTEDMWHAGWYLIRVEQGVMATEDVPARYGRLLVEVAPDYNWCLDDDNGGQNGDDQPGDPADENGDDQHQGDPADENGDDQHQGDPADENGDDQHQGDPEPEEEDCLE
ncbi:MAG: hypothetical protein ACUVSX_10850 [Aggregatilineales bacterium]